MAWIETDDGRWPLVHIRWPSGDIDDASIEAFLALGREHLARRERFLTLHDGMRATGLNARQRRRFADHVRDHEAALGRYMVAAAIVTPSAVVRAVITAINWIAPPPHPQATFASTAEAEAWLWKQYGPRTVHAGAPRGA